MKKTIIFSVCLSVLTACGSGIEKKANERLSAARSAYERGNYDEAKREIDSIKILYPKAFEARKAGQALLMEVEERAQRRRIAVLDSALGLRQQAFEAIKGKYKLEKDDEYQTTGNYLWPTQTVEKNLHRSFLRFQVSEKGVMSMTSIYCGSGSIHHTGVKVTVPDGSFAQTPASKDSYETTDMGEKIEKADYKLGEDGGVIEFLALNKDKNIRIEYIGERKYATTMHPADRTAAAELYELAKILSEIDSIHSEKEKAQLKIDFIRKKKEYKKDAGEML
ncbi:outer membrane protein assembly factor BamD [Bacteroides pyogenes]|uniref:Lipoprotein n=1 Tax=Bacteroides pyogenes TaxID=310300 RepID=A0A5D3FAG9_9BACE|nr:hypothetical protein [Bacteroides pyogenes]MBR8708150.1 hypothetical protein [Bacteroides pyogenes]MBR8717221.1 hypothetical protein [Bacteroides pyogenes]MBR8746527.1 hypothetical protein [Bacteroides pyogenes]MBR8756799.1 hypothetical protein [Bacteroides pyogenes]MBR8780019.1 hypothetical protein [Bacteroides pyogenes]